MGKLLENLDARSHEKTKAQYGEDWALVTEALIPKRKEGWQDVSRNTEATFGPRQGIAVAFNSAYYKTDDYWEGEQEHGLLWGIREMFVDVFLSILDTIEESDLKLVVEPHITSPTKVVVIYKNKFILFAHNYHACHFDFDDAHALEVFMQNIKTFIGNQRKETDGE